VKLNSVKLGTCEVVVYVDSHSAVDSYIRSGTGEYGFELSDEELELLQTEFEAEVQAFAWESGYTSNRK
jgi:hypothetical protein